MIALHEKYIVDDNGKKTAAVLPYLEWQKVMAILEEFEDIRAFDRAKSRKSDPISFKKALKIMKDTRA